MQVQSYLGSLQSVETTNIDKSPKNNNKNLRITWPSGGRQKCFPDFRLLTRTISFTSSLKDNEDLDIKLEH